MRDGIPGVEVAVHVLFEGVEGKSSPWKEKQLSSQMRGISTDGDVPYVSGCAVS